MKTKKDNYLGVLSFIATGLFGAFVGQAVLLPTVNTNADTATTDVSANINPTIAITTEGADETGTLPIEVDSESGVNMGTGTITVKVSTNDPDGYSLYITTDKADNSLSQDGVTDRILALTGETQIANFPENYWGYSVDGGSTYFPVQPNTENPEAYPDKLATAKSAATYDSVANNHETEVTIGAKVKGSLPSGIYSNAVVFTAVPNSVVSAAN